jgi:hypothetical protein
MKSLSALLKGSADLVVGYGVFVLAALFILANKQPETVGLSLGVALILYALTYGNVAVSFGLGALVGLVALHYSRTPWPWPVPMPALMNVEGFADEADEVEAEILMAQGDDEDELLANRQEIITDSINPSQKKKSKRGAMKKARKVPAPDNGERAEFFTLGKKYKMPKEDDDEDYHLDAGTTFMNAYKSLKPDQIASMSKDTQELMNTQKQLIGTLATLKPLITDGKQMMEMFTSYFGNGAAMN